MIAIAFLIAFLLAILTVLVFAIRRSDGERYEAREKDPFFAETARIAAAGLIQAREDRRGRQDRRVFLVTPAGEAALRAKLRDHGGQSDLLGHSFAGIIAPRDLMLKAKELRNLHADRVENFDRVIGLLDGGGADWSGARETAELGKQFEESCVAFWSKQIDQSVT